MDTSFNSGADEANTTKPKLAFNAFKKSLSERLDFLDRHTSHHTGWETPIPELCDIPDDFLREYQKRAKNCQIT